MSDKLPLSVGRKLACASPNSRPCENELIFLRVTDNSIFFNYRISPIVGAVSPHW
jgi:hypothetical protein